MKRESINFLEGRWDIIQSEYYDKDNGWIVERQYEQGEYWWEFLPAERIEIGQIVTFTGTHITHIESEYRTKYSLDFDENNETLIIDCSIYLEDGFLDICIEEWYRPEPRSNQESSYYLNLINEPDYPPPFFRHLIRRVAPPLPPQTE
ncbi:MAG: hypothetical protein SNG35_07580 [Rikenellaceae bacterium]